VKSLYGGNHANSRGARNPCPPRANECLYQRLRIDTASMDSASMKKVRGSCVRTSPRVRPNSFAMRRRSYHLPTTLVAYHSESYGRCDLLVYDDGRSTNGVQRSGQRAAKSCRSRSLRRWHHREHRSRPAGFALPVSGELDHHACFRRQPRTWDELEETAREHLTSVEVHDALLSSEAASRAAHSGAA
jgi:hypothetical protein